MGMQFPPGKKTPEKYQKTGPNYAKWGEQIHNGYVYNPETDTYYYDPKAQAAWKAEAEAEIAGEPPKPPSIWEQGAAASIPTLSAITAMQLAQKPEILGKIPALLGLGGGGGAAAPSFTAQSLGLAGGGGSAAVAAPEVATPTVLEIGGAAPVEAASQGGLLSLGGVGSAGNAILPLAGAALGANLLAVDRLDKNAKGYGRGIGQGALAGAGIGSFFGPPGAAIGAGIGGLLGLAKAATGHKSTAEYQQQRRNELMDRGITGYADYVAKSDADMAANPNDPGIGRVVNKDQLTKEDVVGSNGVFDTFGNNWFGKYTTEQRWQIAQKLVDEGLFDTDHGDVVIYSENQDRARQIANEIVNPKKEEEKQNATV